MMDLNILWFILITVLFTGFFFLEGFDYGVGGILPFLSSDEKERGEVLRTITPVWDGNEVWMITAGGALFAAFPHVYATMFSAFYLALFLMLVALILRGVAFDLRGRSRVPAGSASGMAPSASAASCPPSSGASPSRISSPESRSTRR